MNKILILFCILFLTSCSDAKFSKFTRFYKEVNVICYSGGKTIYEGYSTGQIESIHNSDGWYFEDKSTRNLIIISGDCVFKIKN